MLVLIAKSNQISSLGRNNEIVSKRNESLRDA